jgi:hypothetical protein
MKIYVDKLPKCCGYCLIKDQEHVKCENPKDNFIVSFCQITKVSIDLKERDKSCPLIELKPKELEWIEYGERRQIEAHDINPNEVCRIYVCNTPIGRAIIQQLINARGIVIDFKAITKYIFPIKELIEAKQTISNAKDFCQKYYNKLFYEMRGE